MARCCAPRPGQKAHDRGEEQVRPLDRRPVPARGYDEQLCTEDALMHEIGALPHVRRVAFPQYDQRWASNLGDPIPDIEGCQFALELPKRLRREGRSREQRLDGLPERVSCST